MKPTHTKDYVLARMEDLAQHLKRPATEEEFIQVNCYWAGQSGHEKCGWCKACQGPRFLKRDCKHPLKYIWGRLEE